jgi:hypothetical protein
MTAPKNITPDTTIEEIWDGYATQVLHRLDRGSAEYENAKVNFFAGARGVIGWLVVTMAAFRLPDRIAAREQEVDAELERFITEQRARES